MLLVIILVFFVEGDTSTTSGLLHIPNAGGLYVRLAMLVATVWAVGFSIPVLFKVKVPPPTAEDGAVSRHAYAFCVLERFWRNLKRRDIWAEASTRAGKSAAGWPPAPRSPSTAMGSSVQAEHGLRTGGTTALRVFARWA